MLSWIRQRDRNVAIRRFRSVAEKRRIVELTMEPGASVALVARAHGVNANQVFAWRRAFKSGQLAESGGSMPQLCFRLRYRLHARRRFGEPATEQQLATAGTIHIEFPGRALISVESGADPALLRSILESLRK